MKNACKLGVARALLVAIGTINGCANNSSKRKVPVIANAASYNTLAAFRLPMTKNILKRALKELLIRTHSFRHEKLGAIFPIKD